MNPAATLTASFEKLGLRGAPTLLSYLSKTRLSRRIATVQLPAGQPISFPAYDPYWARFLYARVPYEPDVEAVFRRFAKGRVLVDCGANIGYWSVRAEELGFSDAVAIEANDSWMPFLERNHSGRNLHAAVHSETGITLHLRGEGSAASLSEQGKAVESLALKDLGISGPVLVKLDVEGAEIAAVQGAAGMDAMFVYEDWPRSGMPVTQQLLEEGFAIFGFDMTRIRILSEAFEFNRRTTTRYSPSNLIAMQP
jgi:FkbM family methyltransferase